MHIKCEINVCSAAGKTNRKFLVQTQVVSLNFQEKVAASQFLAYNDKEHRFPTNADVGKFRPFQFKFFGISSN
jgi:hypothetical protein